MLNRLLLKNFTVFKDEVFQFAPSLNVIVGENSVGKTHLLKLLYAQMAVNAEVGAEVHLNGKMDENADIRFLKKMDAVFRLKSHKKIVRREIVGVAGADGKFLFEFANP